MVRNLPEEEGRTTVLREAREGQARGPLYQHRPARFRRIRRNIKEAESGKLNRRLLILKALTIVLTIVTLKLYCVTSN
jgi:hypothetical protein